MRNCIIYLCIVSSSLLCGIAFRINYKCYVKGINRQKFHMNVISTLRLTHLELSTSAQEALLLLHGQESHAPQALLTTVFVAGSYWFIYKFFKLMSSF